MFDTYKTIHDYSQIAKEMELDRKSNERISQNEIKSKDRVDITLEEYERMKSNITRLEHELYIVKNKLEPFKEVVGLNIILDTFHILQSKDCLCRPNRMRCAIFFDYEIE